MPLPKLRESHRLRGQGRVALPVLVGSRDAAAEAWLAWAKEIGREPLIHELQSGEDPALVWLESFETSASLLRWVVAEVAAFEGLEVSELASRYELATLYDLERLWRRAYDSGRIPSTLERAGLEALISALRGLAPAPLASRSTCEPDDLIRSLVGLPELPAVLFALSAPLHRGVARLLRLVRAVPALPVGVTADADILRELGGRLTDIDAAMLREGTSELPLEPDSAPLLKWRTAFEARLAFVADQGLSLDAALRNISAENLRFRSAAEALLYAFLEHWPETRGLFRPNHRPGFNFRTRPVEIDLHAPQLSLAIELDGEAFHLPRDRSSLRERYRLDREKDWILQARGIIVLRFLSEDVGPRLHEIKDRILEAVASSQHIQRHASI